MRCPSPPESEASLPSNVNLILSSEPYRMQLRALSGSLFHGVVSENLKCFESVWICLIRQFSEPSFQIAMAPSSIDFVGSGTIFVSSISSSTPSPEHFGHAP